MTDQSHLAGGGGQCGLSVSDEPLGTQPFGDSHACLPMLRHFEQRFTSDVETALNTIIE